jgi:hypothetical protein
MKELAYHILDIANNSVRGKANEIIVEVIENPIKDDFKLIITDNGVGIPEQVLKTIKDPFTTSRTMRKVGLGIPFLNDTCINCEGSLTIDSVVGKGTAVIATMKYKHIDRPPLGNMPSTMTTLITSEESINIIYKHSFNNNEFEISTNDLKEILGDVPLSQVEVVLWLKDYINENLVEIRQS